MEHRTKLKQVNAGKHGEEHRSNTALTAQAKGAREYSGKSKSDKDHKRQIVTKTQSSNYDGESRRTEGEKTGTLRRQSYYHQNKKTGGEPHLQKSGLLQTLKFREHKLEKRGYNADVEENKNWQKATGNGNGAPCYTKSERRDFIGSNERTSKKETAKQIISTSSVSKSKGMISTELKETAGGIEKFEQVIFAYSRKQEPQSLRSVQQSKDSALVKSRSLFVYRCLEELNGKEPSEVLVFIACRRDAFQNTLKQHLMPDHLALIVKILAKLYAADLGANKALIFSCACKEDFIIQVSQYIMSIPVIGDRDKNRHRKIVSFFQDLLLFLKTITSLLPSHAFDVVDKIFTATEFLLKFVTEQENNDVLVKEMTDIFATLKEHFQACMEDENRNKYTERNMKNSQPPNDFRTLNAIPEPEDILSKHYTFLRPNIVNGAYESIEHYLDVQFRLMREDFIGPLREGILEYIENCNSKQRNKKQINNIRIYPKVIFEHSVVIGSKIGYVVSFDPDKRLRNIVWKHSKRFMHGSLLLFSRDSFKTIVFATVISSETEDLNQGRVVVQLSDASSITGQLFEGEFVMAESEVYFEPYFHILKALQNMNKHNFPMKKYLVEVNTSVNTPSYAMGYVEYVIDRRKVILTQNSTWPTAAELHFNSSQYSAFRSALTKEFVIIQGPPGTGKMFLGLKIAEVLINNEQIGKQPILVVCYTNHALDQFLEGIARMTEDIVRVGGQSKSPVLQKFLLKHKRRIYKSDRREHFNLLAKNIYKNLCNFMSLIKRTQKELEMISNQHGIIAPAHLREVGMTRKQEYCFGNHQIQREMLFLQWLEEGVDPLQDYILPGHCSVPQWQMNQENGEHEEPEDLFHHMVDILDFQLHDWQAAPRLKFVMGTDIDWINEQLSSLNKILEDPTPEGSKIKLRDLELRKRYMIFQLNKEETISRPALERLERQDDLWGLAPKERWSLYKHWINNLRNKLLDELHLLLGKYKKQAEMYAEVQMLKDVCILRDSVVVGMTTTGAARLQKLLKALKPKIVIVEEAAEVLESHIVCALTKHCEHLILIGDHQQLRPSPAVYRLAKEYNLDISLFERMIKNGFPCETLTVQHRMRPEIAELISPSIYANLKNHASVLTYEKICGVLKSVFFVTHGFPEQKVADSTSRRNTHEGDFLIALCRYLILQGYTEDRITILTTYAGQMLYLCEKQKHCSEIQNVHITVVDNFQGEENDIILLSLVRSNKEANIGFLKTENRVCVALSRAKLGLYIIGNMDNLTKSSTIWKDIKATLIKQEALDSHLTLRCQVHVEQFTKVSCAEDFSNVPGGGCKQLCGAALRCGHKCKSVCHLTDREHKNYCCNEPCNRVPANCYKNHRCGKACWQDCGPCQTLISVTLLCGHTSRIPCSASPMTYPCAVKVETVLPCLHKVSKPCHEDIVSFRCPHPCEVRLLCGHRCGLPCHMKYFDHMNYKCSKPCLKKSIGCKQNHRCPKLCHEVCGMCLIVVVKKLPYCEHKTHMHCSEDVNRFLCKRKCKKILPCNHPCPNLCYEKCGNCSVKVSKTLPSCGHILSVECSKAPDPRDCRSKCMKTLWCGHKCTALCSEPCTINCLVPRAVPDTQEERGKSTASGSENKKCCCR